MDRSGLRSLVAAELAEPVDPRVIDMAEDLAARHPAAARAVLFYGSCLRERQLEGLMLDFYLIVSDYRGAYGKSWLAGANRLIPPNVFPLEHRGLASKYAVLSEADFARECGEGAKTVSVWARFAQPSRLVWASGDAARERVTVNVATAAPTLLKLALPMTEDRDDVLAVWRQGFALTYQSEPREERRDRRASIVDSDPERYRRVGEAAMEIIGRSAPSRSEAERIWKSLRRSGKRASVLRLTKASFTFAGGIDYLAWKINRHSGTRVEIKPWQRRWPLLAALTLLPRLLKRGAIR